jgi:hypothetical protein
MLTKLQFQTLFGFKPKRRLSTKKSTSKAGKKVVKKSNKVGTRMIKGVQRTVYTGKNGGKFYKKSNGRKVYFGPALVFAKSVGSKSAVKLLGSKLVEGAGYTIGYKVANGGVSMLKNIIKKKKKKDSKMGRKKLVAGKKRNVYKTATGAKYYKSAKGNKVYFGQKMAPSKAATQVVNSSKKMSKLKSPKKVGKHVHKFEVPNRSGETLANTFGKKRKSRRNNRFGNHGNASLDRMSGPSPMMFASIMPGGL